jgi:phosphoribosyl 1,2-cyclic phosphodiesterase
VAVVEHSECSGISALGKGYQILVCQKQILSSPVRHDKILRQFETAGSIREDAGVVLRSPGSEGCDPPETIINTEAILRFSVLSSGSSGNAIYVETGERGFLVDAGLSCSRLRGLLARVGRDLSDVSAVLLTHGHADHTSGVRSLLRECKMPLYAAPGVAETVGAAPVDVGEALDLGGAGATFFEVPHDAPTYGLRISNGERTGALATDLGEVGPETLRALRGADAVVLEANHDPGWLRRGPYSADLKRRVASPDGHLSNHQAAEAACALAPHGLKDLVLAHLSETNNSPARACGTVRRALREAGYGGVRVRAAIAGHPTPWIEVGQPVETKEYVYRYGGEEEGSAQRLFDVE